MATTVSPVNIYHARIEPPGAGKTLVAFKADTVANARTACQSLATILGVSLRLIALEVVHGGEDTFAPGGQGGNVTAPAVIAWSPR